MAWEFGRRFDDIRPMLRYLGLSFKKIRFKPLPNDLSRSEIVPRFLVHDDDLPEPLAFVNNE